MNLQAYGDKIVLKKENVSGAVKGERRENIGVVDSIGDLVKGLRIGQKVLFEGALSTTKDGFVVDQGNILAIIYE